jgi:hypothetical protein
MSGRGRYRKPPVGRRARARAKNGDGRKAREWQALRERLGHGRCAGLEELAHRIALEEGLNVNEHRFLGGTFIRMVHCQRGE